MTLARARLWADFLTKLGVKITKKRIVDIIVSRGMGDYETWEYFVESRSQVREAANYNRFYNELDVESYFCEVSYKKMRGTYPSRSHGRTLIAPRLITIQDIERQCPRKKETPVSKVALLDHLIGKQIVHVTYGQGIIVKACATYIAVDFETHGNKTLSYQLCKSKGLITIAE